MNLIGIESCRVDDVWNEIKQLVERACARSFPKFTVDNIKAAVMRRDMQLWVIVEEKIYAVIVTEIINYPLRRVCRVLIATGSQRERWQHLISEIENWAADHGCVSMDLLARPGWKRILKGYRHSHDQLEKDLKRVIH